MQPTVKTAWMIAEAKNGAILAYRAAANTTEQQKSSNSRCRIKSWNGRMERLSFLWITVVSLFPVRLPKLKVQCHPEPSNTKTTMQCTVLWQASPESSAMYAARFSSAVRGPASRKIDAMDVHGQLGNGRELQLRTRPLREQWEARGPGLLMALSRRLPWLILPRTVTVALVHPARGGGGLIVSDTTICFEAVLANPLPQLPEVVRLGWFVAQLAARQVLAKVCVSGPDRVTIDILLAAALIPPVLSAGEHVELSSVDTVMIQTALRAWHLTSQPNAVPSAKQLDQWWRQDGSIDTQDAGTWWQAVDASLRVT